MKIITPFTDEIIEGLQAGQQILLSGEIYTARDAAHKRMVEQLDRGKTLAVSAGSVLYYCGVCPAQKEFAVGSAGPTTSGRMDKYSPQLIAAGLKVMIGKGERSTPVIEAIRKYKGIYLSAVGGAGALYAKCVQKAEVIAFPDLGTEAIHRLTVHEMPLVVAIDCKGDNIYELRG